MTLVFGACLGQGKSMLDAVVVHTRLVAANLRLDAGRNVMILEAKEQPGELCAAES